MTLKRKLLLTSAAVTMATAAPFGANAEEAAKPASDFWAEHGGYTFSGEFEVGGRAFIRRPPDSAFPWWGQTFRQPLGLGDRNNISKFEEYGQISPGPYFEYLRATLESKDGVWWNELRADNVGYNNQRFVFDAIKAGEHYFTFMWDQIPHLYSTSAFNIWNGVGTDNLTTAVAFPSAGLPRAGLLVAGTQLDPALVGKYNIIDVGIMRYRASAAYRWTPDPYWDVKASYFGEKRVGTQIAGTVFSGPGPGNLQQFQMPRPVDDTTQIGKLNTEYFGATPWGGHYNVNFGGGVSLFDNSFQSFTVQNPFSDPAAAKGLYPAAARISLMPSNQAYNGIVTTGLDLPMKTRWNSTFQYTSMRQDEQFLPYTITPEIYLRAPGFNGIPAWTTAGLPAQSLNGEVNTLLYNTSVSTQWSSQWKTTFKYRYYNNDNRSPELLLAPYVPEDSTATVIGGVATAVGGNAVAATNPTFRRAIAMGYVKQNASEEVQYRPANWATLGTTVGWEGWDRTHRDANHTNEFIGKQTGDFRFSDIATLRSSLQYSQRRYDKYDPGNLALYAWQSTTPTGQTPATTNYLIRKFDMAHRNQTKGMAILDISGPSGTVFRDFVISPNLGFKNDDYVEPEQMLGLKKSHSWNAGIDVTHTFRPGNWVQASYLYEQYDRFQAGATTTSTQANVAANPASWSGNTHEKVHTIMASTNVQVIPGKLDLKVGYSISFSSEDWDTGTYLTYPTAVAANSLPFPTTHYNLQRLDTSLKHTVDPDIVAKLGWTGEVFVKARYVWERSSVDNWQQEAMTPFLYYGASAVSRAIEMGGTNPNYDAQFVQLSLNAKW
jgi:MtrB/PioB family decaheme-associated outer membrane protein